MHKIVIAYRLLEKPRMEPIMQMNKRAYANERDGHKLNKTMEMLEQLILAFSLL